ncbi:MAG TPA: sigma-70 family RNA polymerase sigma factor [Pyrinomonadaceae bacterium]|nr:sigma-70 family RNA polymerase sigma factor [Pyrinomonadaceae bacterium]
MGLNPGSASGTDVTQLLHDWRNGDAQALEQLMSVVYDDLRRLAAHYMRRERPEHTLQPTALVNEAYVRLAGINVSWKDRTHFLAVVARLMRRLLVDHARAHQRVKRTSPKISLEEAAEVSAKPALDVVELDHALTRFATFDRRKVEIIELHFFGRMSNEEVAEALGISRATVQRELRLAKAWLKHELSRSS